MGQLVTLPQAAALVGRHERIVRKHITEYRDLPAQKEGRGGYRIDTDDLAAVSGWRLDRALLARLAQEERATPAQLAARLEALEQEMLALRQRLTRLEGQIASESTAGSPRGAALEALPAHEGQGYQPITPKPSAEPVNALQGHQRIRLRVFAQKHGIPGGTAIHQGVNMLAFPITLQASPNRRNGEEEENEYWLTADQQPGALDYWRGHPKYRQCGRADCPCYDMPPINS